MGMSARISSMIGFLRAGYSSGAPDVGYAPLLALLPRRVSEDELTTIASNLLEAERGSADSADVGVEITRVTGEMPSATDIARVRRRLGAMR